MSSRNPFANGKTKQVVRRWPVLQDNRQIGAVVFFDQPVNGAPVSFDAVLPNGKNVGAFPRRSDAALAVAANVGGRP